MNRNLRTFACIAIFSASLAAGAVALASSRGEAWTLPAQLPVVDHAPRTYHFQVDYNTANVTGEVVQRQRIAGDYTRGLPNNEVLWRDVSVATASGPDAPFGAPARSDFMENFRYQNDPSASFTPTFFANFPATAFMERNLVWDVVMFESFAHNHFEQLKLNVPLHTGAKNQDVHLPGVGTFRNHDIVLEWVGVSERNGQKCALILYRAFFNPLDINAGVTMKARSDYWGAIWVSLSTKQIEYATLYEEVIGQITFPGQDTPQPMNVFRIGTFAPVSLDPATRK